MMCTATERVCLFALGVAANQQLGLQLGWLGLV